MTVLEEPQPLPEVLSEFALSNAFLGKIIEVCIITEDCHRTMAGLVRLGIGPFRVYTFDDATVSLPMYRGQASSFSLKVCFATNAGLTWEIMQPLSGPTIMREFLDKHGEGIHHLAFDCNGAPWDQRIATFTQRGFTPIQSGRWVDQNSFSFFDTEAATTTCFETYHFPDDFEYPEPEEWYPQSPPLISESEASAESGGSPLSNFNDEDGREISVSNDDRIWPFHIDTSQPDLDDLAVRLAMARWPDELPGVGWDYGVASRYLRELAGYWHAGYDWRAQESRLNQLAQFLTEIDGQRVHFLHVRSPQAGALPILMTHGWPSTFADFYGVVAPLTRPAAHGAADQPAFDMVIPSLPGYAYSGPTRSSGWNVTRIANAWAELMRRLGYSRYLVQGGDFGSIISAEVARAAPDAVIGVHINAMINGASVDWQRLDPLAGLTADDIASVQATDTWWRERSGYAKLQSTRPQTLAYALTDSPLGLLAWIVDLEWAVGDDIVDGETPVDRDAILTAASIYWLTRTAGSSARLYKEHGGIYRDMQYNPLPTAVAVFPRDSTLRSLAERHHNVVRFTHYDRGGHFAALQAPDLLVSDIRAFSAQLNAADAPSADGGAQFP